MNFVHVVLILFVFISSGIYPQKMNFKNPYPIRKKNISFTDLNKSESRRSEFRKQREVFDIPENSVKNRFISSDEILTGYTLQEWNGKEWIDSLKYSVTLDERNYAVEEIWEDWTAPEWVNYSRLTTSRDLNGNWNEMILYRWEGDWLGFYRETQTFYSDGRVSDWITSYWNGAEWKNDIKESSAYDEGGFLKSLTYYFWYDSVWINLFMIGYHNDENGNWTENIEYSWIGQWQATEKETRNYDQGGNWLEWVHYLVDSSGGWIPLESEVQEYDRNGNWITWIYSSYENPEYGEPYWEPEMKRTAVYNGLNKVEETSYSWNGSGWINLLQETAEYDIYNNQIELTQTRWEGGWINIAQFSRTYDQNNNNTVYIYKEWEGMDWKNILKYNYSYSSTTDNEESGKELFTYTLSSNFPNPFNPSTTIKYNIPEAGFVSLKVYDAVGKEAASLVNEIKAPGEYSVRFNADNLASGVYIYQITVNNYISVRKMILLK